MPARVGRTVYNLAVQTIFTALTPILPENIIGEGSSGILRFSFAVEALATIAVLNVNSGAAYFANGGAQYAPNTYGEFNLPSVDGALWNLISTDFGAIDWCKVVLLERV